MENNEYIAYFSLEIALDERYHTYAGGLGILAGDILRAAADINAPLVGVTLLNRQGYFRQVIGPDGQQQAASDPWFAPELLIKSSQTIDLEIKGEAVRVGAWFYYFQSSTGGKTPVMLLDTDFPENSPAMRLITDCLYGGSPELRLAQEIVLGRGGVKMLEVLGYQIKAYHLNEGHCFFAPLELLSRESGEAAVNLEIIRKKCVSTIHTSIPSAQGIYDIEWLGEYQPDCPQLLSGLAQKGQVGTTDAVIYFSRFTNAVSENHRRVVAEAFGEKITAITNGVHSVFWSAPEFQKIYDQYCPGWRQNNSLLKEARNISDEDMQAAHQSAKRRLLDYIAQTAQVILDQDVLTIVFARRFAPYKQATMLLSDPERLVQISQQVGRIQIIYAGKAHPADPIGQGLIAGVQEMKKKLDGRVSIVFLENYNIALAKLLTAGADVWLNNPLPPNEACGTSGMKAAHNGVLHLSTLDGWWPEAYVADRNGWVISEASDLYERLEKEIIPTYYHNQPKWLEMMGATISLNASRFNAENMLRQYLEQAY